MPSIPKQDWIIAKVRLKVQLSNKFLFFALTFLRTGSQRFFAIIGCFSAAACVLGGLKGFSSIWMRPPAKAPKKVSCKKLYTWFVVALLDWIFPKKCIGCGAWGSYICSNCEVGIWEEEQICPVCTHRSFGGIRHPSCSGPLSGLTCFWSYEGLTRKAIQGAKYYFYYDYLKELVRNIDQMTELPEFNSYIKFLVGKPQLVPVPLSKERQRWRGFNQAEVIAKVLAEKYQLQTRNWLIRRRRAGQQVGKSREERLAQVKGIFEAKDVQPGVTVLLVDDVWTTGATMRECAKVLKANGAGQVWGWTLAR